MKTIILYASTHHGNTKKVVERIAQKMSARMVDVVQEEIPDISGYKLIGLASGVYFGDFHENLRKFAEETDFTPAQKVFLIDTCGIGYKDYTYKLRMLLEGKGVSCLGRFQCRGYDTYGPWRFLGGIARKHPDERDLRKAEYFAQRMKTGK